MLSKRNTIIIILFWFATFSWYLYREWYIWFSTSNTAPSIFLDLSDEISGRPVNWTVYVNGNESGNAFSVFRYYKDSEEYLNQQILKKFGYQLQIGKLKVEAKIPSWNQETFSSLKGELKRFTSRIDIRIELFGTEIKAIIDIQGTVHDDEITGTVLVESPLIGVKNRIESVYGPIPIKSHNVFHPLQLTHRLQGVYPGRSWKVSNYDPIQESMRIALTKMIDKILASNNQKLPFPIKLPTEKAPLDLIAEVLPNAETITWEEKPIRCYVISYKTDDWETKIYVRVRDGYVLRQEAHIQNETIVIERQPERKLND